MFDNEKIGIVGPRLLFPNGKIQSVGGQYDGGKGPYHRYLGYDANYEKILFSSVVSWMTGAFFVTRRELFEKVGGFDEGFVRGYFEDVDYCEAAKKEGYECWYCAESIFIHQGGQSTQSDELDKRSLSAHQFRQNSVRFHKKWDSVIKPNIASRLVPY